jgi:hypothetical protein
MLRLVLSLWHQNYITIVLFWNLFTGSITIMNTFKMHKLITLRSNTGKHCTYTVDTGQSKFNNKPDNLGPYVKPESRIQTRVSNQNPKPGLTENPLFQEIRNPGLIKWVGFAFTSPNLSSHLDMLLIQIGPWERLQHTAATSSMASAIAYSASILRSCQSNIYYHRSHY